MVHARQNNNKKIKKRKITSRNAIKWVKETPRIILIFGILGLSKGHGLKKETAYLVTLDMLNAGYQRKTLRRVFYPDRQTHPVFHIECQ